VEEDSTDRLSIALEKLDERSRSILKRRWMTRIRPLCTSWRMNMVSLRSVYARSSRTPSTSSKADGLGLACPDRRRLLSNAAAARTHACAIRRFFRGSGIAAGQHDG